MRAVRLNVDVEEPLWRAIKQAALDRSTTVADMLRYLLRETYVDKIKRAG